MLLANGEKLHPYYGSFAIQLLVILDLSTPHRITVSNRFFDCERTALLGFNSTHLRLN